MPCNASWILLGQLARVFQNMAREVHLREQRLKQQLQQLRLDMDVMKKEHAEPISIYMPMDRRQAIVRGESLPSHARRATCWGSSRRTSRTAKPRGAGPARRIYQASWGSAIFNGRGAPTGDHTGSGDCCPGPWAGPGAASAAGHPDVGRPDRAPAPLLGRIAR